MISEEIKFAQSLERVRRAAGQQGNRISGEQVKAEFADLKLNGEQLRLIFDYLEKHGISTGEFPDGENAEEALSERERDYLQAYLDGIGGLPVCSDEEKRALAEAAAAGDGTAGQRLAESCLRDVADIARLYVGQGVPLEDLIGEGNVALTLGIGALRGRDFRETEDSEKEFSNLQGELARGIMDAMEACIRENADSKKKDKRVADRVNKVAEKAGKLAGELHRKVTPGELAEETGLSLKAIEDAVRMSGYKIEDIEYAEDGL